jgi:hypothetical protein
MFQIAHAGAAMVFVNGNAKHAEITEFPPKISGEFIGLVYFCRARRDFISGKACHLISQHIGGLAKVEIKPRKAVWNIGHAQPVAFHQFS